MVSSTSSSCVLIALGVLLLASSAYGAGLCTGYPKMYNGKPCASTTRYWDSQMGACGCGTGNTSPFSWQWTKPTAAASAPIFGSGTWCGSGCGKCFRLTPTGAGASVAGKGAPNTKSLVVKVTNLCPYSGNEEWCAMDVNSHDYDAHFDLMDQNMNGIITAQGWDNPEVTYEEVDCASNGYVDWSCQCASGGSTTSSSSSSSTKTTTAPVSQATTKPTTKATAAPTAKATSAPTAKATTKPTSAPTSAPPTAKATTKATTAPASGSSTPIKVTLKPGVSSWWIGFTINTDVSMVEIMDSAGGAFPAYTAMGYHGDQYWGMYFINPKSEMKLPLSLRFTSAAGKTVAVSQVINTWAAAEVNTNASL